jgi:tetratricopeptide (TPR) repeat protein
VDGALGELEALGDERGVASGMLAAARAAFYQGRCDASTGLIERLLERGTVLSARDSRDAAIALMISGYFGTANPDELERIRERSMAIMGTEGPLVELTLSMNAMAQSSFRGQVQETIAHADRIERIWAEIGGPDAEITSNQGLGEAMRRIGNLERAERYFRSGVDGLDRLGETGFNSAILARALVGLERWDEAEAMVERSRSLTADDDFASQAEWRMGLAEVLAHRGQAEEALPLVDEAVEIVEATDYLEMEADAHETRALVLEALGRTDEARAELETARVQYGRKGSVPAVARVDRRLAELGARPPE